MQCLYRGLLIFSFVMLFLGLLDRLIMVFGYRLTFIPIGPAKLLQFSAIFVLFAIALLLRQIREKLTK